MHASRRGRAAARYTTRGSRMTARRTATRARGLGGVLALVVAGSGLVGSVAPAEAGDAVSHAATSAVAAHATRSAGPSRGSAGIGDGYFPKYGNGGYRVSHYDVDVAFNPATERLQGRTVVHARATKSLSRFDLDLVLPASQVLVNGR